MLALLSVVFQFLSAAIVITPLLLLLNIFYIKDIKKTAFYFVYGIYICGVYPLTAAVPFITPLFWKLVP